MKDLEQREERTKLTRTITDSLYGGQTPTCILRVICEALPGPQLIQNFEALASSLDVH